MARHVYIFCQDAKNINFKDIAEFIKDGWWFDECPEFNIGEESFVEIQYDPNLRPILIELFDDPKMVEEIKKETYEEELENVKCTSIDEEKTKSEIVGKIGASTHIYNIEFSWSDLSGDCWAMKACVEAFLAREKKGLILADEGVYDENLQLIMKF